jgi:polyisoprenyl-phosphate glycosyltransferase
MKNNVATVEIVIPCYNEFENLPHLLDEAKQVVEISNFQINFILVNNGSSDQTENFFQLAQIDGIRFLSTKTNLGYGGGILLGLAAANARYLGWTHADLQTPLSDLLKFLPYLNSENIFFKGKRVNRKIIDRLFSLGMGFFESLLFQKRIVEVNAQPTIAEASFLRTLNKPPSDFSLDLYALVMAHRMRLKVMRIEVNFLNRRHGYSKWNSGVTSRIRFISRTIIYSLRLKGSLSANNKT